MNQNRKAVRASTVVLLIFLASSIACKRSLDQSKSTPLPGLSAAVRISSGNADASEPAIASAPDGNFYVAWVEHGANSQADVMLARFTSDGRLDGSVTRVNSQPGLATAWRGDPPTVAVATDGTVYVGWAARVGPASGHATDLYLSSSKDQGRTFGVATRVNDDSKPADHGLHSLAVANDGRIYVSWLDERNIAPVEMKDMKMDPQMKGHHMESNRELFFASSADGGRTFTANQRVATDVCPCCKTSVAVGLDHRVYLSWRQVLPGDYRHIAITSSADQGRTFAAERIVSDDQWAIPGCPVSGAAIAIAVNGNLRALWYSAGKNGQTGLYSSESNDHGATFQPRILVAAAETRGTPVLFNDSNGAHAVWESGASDAPKILMARVSPDRKSSTEEFLLAEGALPAVAETGRRLVFAYVAKGEQHQEIRVATMTAVGQ
jgi:hypothetical protein